MCWVCLDVCMYGQLLVLVSHYPALLFQLIVLCTCVWFVLVFYEQNK